MRRTIDLRPWLAVASLALSACGSPVTHREPDEYTGCGSDEQFRSFDDYEPMTMTDDANGPQLTAPDVTKPIAFSPKPVFQWNVDTDLAGMPTGDVPYMDGTPSCMSCCPEFNIGALTSAHLPAISGDVYDLQFFDSGGNEIHRVVTTLQEWTADDGTWSSWKGQTFTLKIFRISVLLNDIKAGPYLVSHPPSFTVGS